MLRISNSIKVHFPIILFHLVFLATFLSNFPWGKMLIGWDAINPELNYSINFSRSLFASWQENYGVGLLAGHGFASLLPHTIITFLLSIFFSNWAIRSVFLFLCLYLGGIGMYVLCRLILTIWTRGKHDSPKIIRYIPLLVSLFYMLNLGTVQNFYLPLEPYLVHFAILPWLFWSSIQYLITNKKKYLLYFVIVNLFASIQGFIPSVFVSCTVAFAGFLLIFAYTDKTSLVNFKKSAILFCLYMLVNAYWFFPFMYYQFTNNSTEQAYNNIQSTQEFIDKSHKYGDLSNVALLKGFYFDSKESDQYVLQPWKDHLELLSVRLVGYGFFIVSVMGLIFGILFIKDWIVKGFVGVSLISFLGLAINIIPFSIINKIILFFSPSYSQAFRTTFTKYSTLTAFSYSIFIATGLYLCIIFLYHRTKSRLINVGSILFFVISILYYSFPILQGNLIYNKIKLNIPSAYIDVMRYMRDKPAGRITDLPQDCSEGWYGYNWGYFGSGFNWYGIEQPIMSRTFDVWSKNNENYYWEIVQSVRKKDYIQMENVLRKYDVKWLIYDPNLIHCRITRAFIGYDDVIKYLENSPDFSLLKTIQSNGLLPIKIYEHTNNSSNRFVSIKSNMDSVLPRYTYGNNDIAFNNYRDYISSNTYDSGKNIYYPFRSLFTGRGDINSEFTLKDEGDHYLITSSIPLRDKDQLLVIPELDKEEFVEINPVTLEESEVKYPLVYLDDTAVQLGSNQNGNIDAISSSYVPVSANQIHKLTIVIPKISGYYSYNTNFSGDPKEIKSTNCGMDTVGLSLISSVYNDSTKYLRLSNTNSSRCLIFDLPEFTHKISYIFSLDTRNVEGNSLLFSLINKTNQTTDIEAFLPKTNQNNIFNFIQPPMNEFGQGYSVQLKNASISEQRSLNDILNLSVHPIPYRLLSQLKVIDDTSTVQLKSTSNSDSLDVYHPNPTYYSIVLNRQLFPQQDNDVLVLSQSFDDGWKAYEIKCSTDSTQCAIKKFLPFIFGTELNNHVLVNNWENGWKIDNNTESLIVIYYLPQLLEFTGFGMLLGIPVLIILTRKKSQTIS